MCFSGLTCIFEAAGLTELQGYLSDSERKSLFDCDQNDSMSNEHQRIEQLEKAALDREIISQLTPSKETRRKNEKRACDLLRQANKLKRNHPEK